MFNGLSAIVLALVAQVAPQPPSEPATPAREDPFTQTNTQAWSAIQARQPQAAFDALTPAVAAYEADLKGEKRRVYCGMSPAEAIAYLALGAKDKTGSVVVLPGYCEALFLQGFASVDLGHHAEAKAIYDKLLALAPMNAHFNTEYGQLLGREKNWGEMLKRCNRAEGYADLGAEEARPHLRGEALRCQGFALIEQGKLDEAEKRFREALSIDANDAKAQGELRYISEQRKGSAKT